jgi:hypothetical protein
MLREILYVKQERKRDRRRWFTDEYWDLYVWVRTDGTYSGFQLCYGKTDHQRALTWMEGSEPTHTGVREDDGPRESNMTAILVTDGAIDVRDVSDRFRKDSAEIDSEVRQYVSTKLKQLMSGGDPGPG